MRLVMGKYNTTCCPENLAKFKYLVQCLVSTSYYRTQPKESGTVNVRIDLTCRVTN